MKKILLIGFVLGLVVAMTAPAMAVDWTVQGAMNIKAAYYKNLDLRNSLGQLGPPVVGDLDPAWNRQSAWVQMRTVLMVTARANENLYLSSVFGYLIGGKALLSMDDGDRAQDPWMWVTTLSYAF